MSDENAGRLLTFNDKGQALAWTCGDSGLSVLLYTDEMLFGDVRMEIRLPPSAPIKDFDRWFVGPGGRAMHLLTTQDVSADGKRGELFDEARFTRLALENSTIVLRAHDKDFRSVTATFD